MARVLLTSLLAAVIMFIWGSIFWMSPIPYNSLSYTADDRHAGQALLEHFPETGTYLIPGPQNDPSVVNELYLQGPIATLHIQREGTEPMAPSVFVKGFVHEWVACLIIVLLVKMALPGLNSYGRRLIFISLAGVGAALFTNFAQPIWWHHPWVWYCYTFAYEWLAWTFAGVAIAALIKPAKVN